MRTMNQMLRDEKGQGIMEYVLIAIVIGLIVLFTAARFGSSIRDRFTKAGETVDSTKITDTDDADSALSAE